MPRIVNSSPTASKVYTVLVIAAYKEFDNLKELLNELDLLLPANVAIIVADDTGVNTEAQIVEIVQGSLSAARNWLITFEDKKSGRGSAVLRGFLIAQSHFSEAEYFAECDADGSHRPIDIAKILLAAPSEFLIGSRYLPESRIEGWPVSRRIASRILNYLIPKALGIKCTDVTNGLRRYSKIATEAILKHPQVNAGFIFLSEQAIVLSSQGINPIEEPITFVNRIYGESSVGLSEVVNSLKGVGILYKNSRRNIK
jgi:dolichol-phosphate mannosyltransferase